MKLFAWIGPGQGTKLLHLGKDPDHIVDKKNLHFFNVCWCISVLYQQCFLVCRPRTRFFLSAL